MNVQKAIFSGYKATNSTKFSAIGIKELNGPKHAAYRPNSKLHVTAQVKYPEAKHIPLPKNIQAIMSAEIGQFSPLRARDLTGPVLFSKTNHFTEKSSVVYGREPVFYQKNSDPFIENYDCHGAVNLNSSMQTNVPHPFQSKGNTMYLNMPGGQWEQGNKFLAEDMQKSSKHYLNNLNNKKNKGIKFLINNSVFFNGRLYSTDTTINNKPVSRKEKLKKAVAEYGSTVIIFHVGISLMSLGICYTLVSSGLDVPKYLSYIPWIDLSSSTITQSAGTFVAAYAIHKVFAPVRISITLGSAPFIVRYLRNKGILKPVAK